MSFQSPPRRTMTVEEFRALGKTARVGMTSKYHSKMIEFEGITYHSKAEFTFELHLRFLKTMGRVTWWTRQVPFYLPGGKRYLVDFLVMMKNGDVRIVDVKGFDTKVSQLKRSVVQGLTAVRVEIVPGQEHYSWGMT